MSCPNCFYTRYWKLRRNKKKCKRCRREYTEKLLLYGIRASKSEWRLVITTFLEHRTLLKVYEKTKIGRCRVSKMLHQIRLVMLHDVPGPFSGICEADETFIGGQWKNKRRSIRKKGTPKGHGTLKTPVVGVYSREKKQVRVQIVSKRNEKNVIGFMVKQLQPHALLYTDGYKMNRAVCKYGIAHEYVNHHLGEFVRGNIHTNSIEGFWGYLKRNLATIGGIRHDRLHLFVGEITWRFNYRNFSISEQSDRIFNLLLGG